MRSDAFKLTSYSKLSYVAENDCGAIKAVIHNARRSLLKNVKAEIL